MPSRRGTERASLSALQDLEPQQLLLFVQSFGIPVSSMSKLLQYLDQAVAHDPQTLEQNIMDKSESQEPPLSPPSPPSPPYATHPGRALGGGSGAGRHSGRRSGLEPSRPVPARPGPGVSAGRRCGVHSAPAGPR